MKKAFFSILCLGFSIFSYSQDQVVNGNLLVNGIIDNGNLKTNKLKSILARIEEGNADGEGTYIGVKSYYSQKNPENNYTEGSIKMFSIEHKFYGELNNSIDFYRGGSTIGGHIGMSVYDGTEYFRFSKALLEVLGTIRATEVKVETGWSDFVFEKDYKLPTLQEVENHINEHKHLPDIPSEAEVKENGVSLGEMQAKLLQKIEELTLYTIELNKTVKEQGEKIQKLEADRNNNE